MVSASVELQKELLGRSSKAISQTAARLKATQAQQDKASRSKRGKKRTRELSNKNLLPGRRSSRLTHRPPVSYTGADETSAPSDSDASVEQIAPRSSFSKQAAAFTGENEPVSLASGAKVVSVAPCDVNGTRVSAPVSSKLITAAVGACEVAWLGKYIPFSIAGSGAKAKAAAMYVLGAHPDTGSAAPPAADGAAGDSCTPPIVWRCSGVKFNKMSGIQEWANAVALFVNVDVEALPGPAPPAAAAAKPAPPAAATGGRTALAAGPPVPSSTGSRQQAAGPAVPEEGGSAPSARMPVPGLYNTAAYHKDGSAYGNQFSEGGRSITWFAQPRHTIQTPVLQRIIPGLAGDEGAAASGKSASGGAGDTPVVLFLRLPGRPYVFAGRCKAAAVDSSSSPIRVQWRMQHFDALSAQAATVPELQGWRDMREVVFAKYGAPTQ